ncbi:MAG TPA: DUF1566 domain-containing protein [Candidatus Binatia bacterium]|nr:DUF1566 domain-containing protein [Candidatus Binatia bacterium]
MTTKVWTAAVVGLLLASSALAATPAQNCQSGKNKEAGKYAACRQRAEATFALTGDAAGRTARLATCGLKYGLRWPQIESLSGGSCPSSGDQTAIQGYLDTATTDVAKALGGEPLAGQAQTLKTTQTRCWNGSGQEIPCVGTGQDGEFQTGLDRGYVDNGDGTITDTNTGLMWEKLSRDGSIHDKELQYTWAQALAVKVAGLNSIAFAGHTDWRLPNVNELYSLIRLYQYTPAVSSPAFHWNCIVGCTVLDCSCTYTQSSLYWTSTSEAQYPGAAAWYVGFHDGTVGRRDKKYLSAHVRAVRGG